MRQLPTSVLMAILLLACACGCAKAVNSNEAENAGLLHYIETDECIYALADSVQISYVVTNITAEPIGILLPMVDCPLWLRVYEPQGGEEVWVNPTGCLAETGGVILEPGESLERDAVWHVRNIHTGQPIEEPGLYTVEGELFALDSAIRFAVQVGIQLLDSATGVAIEETVAPSSWGTVKSIYR